ncbi:hypothetical protein GCM10023188_26010 [Pontibacter saemangeumensis]|uniref:Helix-turn-helix domain-containing protein n=1 Tax=Pontibacter saemangeumensis TaxID=1084525 RepID=A0ABP8LSV4_9BACT
MNYIELINNFWQANKEHCFTGNETALYFYLLHTCNSLGWKNPFKHSNGYITGTLGISEKTLIASRNALKQANLLDFDSSRGRRVLTSYSLKAVKITGFREETGKVLGKEQVSFLGTNSPDNIKLNKTKLNNKKRDSADAPPSLEKEEDHLPKQPTKKEKEITPGSAAPPKEKDEVLHQDFVDAYHNWYLELVGTKPRVLESDFAALKKIRRYLTDAKKGDGGKALSSWQYILDNWGKLEDFLQKQMRPAQIDSNMTNILAQLRTTHQKVTENANHKGNNHRQQTSRQPAGESIDEIEARYR